jgi:predicted Rossmann fold nucleotide-binding protein DprA/Smf involved in DNA uptake
MDSGGKTLLVMGCGHGNGYLPENSDLRKRVASNGALISEYPPFSPVTRSSFPERNRIISALSKGVVIVEAAERSGTISTANWALKQGRDLFVLPGDIESGNFTGSNKLITEGATAVFSGDDGNGYSFVIASKSQDMNSFRNELNSKLNGRGGGRDGMIQGKATTTKEKIIDFFKEV